ncbi:MAG: hypothetical protein KIS96_04765 [Bauldia sp.]|nr:hypothetical protein [Bauldia sp.]
MFTASKTLRALSVVIGASALPFAAASAADTPLPPPPPPVYDLILGIPGCYQVVSGLPDGFTMAFCLNPDHDGTYGVAMPGFRCENRLDWGDHHDGKVHIDFHRLRACGNANQIMTDDAECTIGSGGALHCILEAERGIPPRQIVAVRAN